MSESPTTEPGKRPDDRRGAPAGQFGNVAHKYDPEVATRVRQLAQRFPIHGEHHIAAAVGMHRDTLRKYYAAEMAESRSAMLAAVAGQVIARALDENAEGVKGDLDAQKFILARLGGWSTKVELSGPAGGPVETVNLSSLTADQLREYGILAALARGQDPEEVVGRPDDR